MKIPENWWFYKLLHEKKAITNVLHNLQKRKGKKVTNYA